MRRALLALPLLVACASAPAAFDPVAMDPAGASPEAPARLVATAIPSHGKSLYASVYVAEGPGPHPTAVLLHGLPGNERNLDLAHVLQRAGWNAIFFHYRGAWGSEGEYAFRNVFEDAAAVVRWALLPANAETLRGRPERLALVGHSVGGLTALTVGGELDGVDCVVSIAGANLGPIARAAAADPQVRRDLAARFEALTGPLAGTSGQALVDEIRADPDSFDPVLRAPSLARKPLLLVAGSRDRTVPIERNHRPLVEALRAEGAGQLREIVLDTDHDFAGRRVALARAVVGWLEEECRAERSAP